jgi:hypothetical protein
MAEQYLHGIVDEFIEGRDLLRHQGLFLADSRLSPERGAAHCKPHK